VIHKAMAVLQICTILREDIRGPSSETSNWVISVKVEEDDPLAITFPAVKAEPGVSLFVRHISPICA
jgi:hypothetical protein